MWKKQMPKYIRDIRKLMKEGKTFEDARDIAVRRTGYGLGLTEKEYRERIKRGY